MADHFQQPLLFLAALVPALVAGALVEFRQRQPKFAGGAVRMLCRSPSRWCTPLAVPYRFFAFIAGVADKNLTEKLRAAGIQRRAISD